jgi:hypothetical protein
MKVGVAMVRVTTALVLMAGLALQPAIAEEMRSEAVHFPAGQTEIGRAHV